MQVKKLLQKVVMGAILGVAIISFGFVGMNSNVLGGFSPSTVVQADKRKVTQDEFSRIFNNVLTQMEQERGAKPTTEQAVAEGMDAQILQQLANEESTMALITRLGLNPGLALISERIKEQTAFFDPVTGQFDPARFSQLLGENNLTEREFRTQLSDSIARQHLYSALGAGFKAPVAYSALEAIRATQQRDVEYFYLTASSVEAVGAPTDAQLTEFIRAQNITKPERRQLTVVRFNAAALAGDVTVAPEELERLIDFKVTEATTPEVRTLVQIPAKDQATATQIQQRLQRGEEPEAVAAALKTTANRYDAKPKTAIPDRKAADAAFALASGAVSGPIQGDLGLSVVKVFDVRAGSAPERESLRAAAQGEARLRAANAKVSEMSDALLDAVDKGEDLAVAARRIGASVQVVGPVARNGSLTTGQMVTGVSQPVVETGFQTSQGQVSDIAQEGEGQFFAVRVDQIVPSAAPGVEEVRSELSGQWRLFELQRRLEAKATEISAAVRAGQTLQQAAASAGASVQTLSGLSQANAQAKAQETPGALLTSSLTARGNTVFTGAAPVAAAPGSTPAPRMFVGRMVAQRLGSVEEMAQIAQRAEQSVMQAQQQLMALQMDQSSRQIIEPKIHPDRARQALGVADAPPAGEKGAPPADKK